MNVENLIENRYQKLRAIGTSATTFKPLSDPDKKIKTATEKIIEAGKIKSPQTKPIEV
jgi:hypothetical protein